MNQKEQIEQKLKKLKPFLQEKYNVTTLGYFGSFAKNKVTENSDIDPLVEFSETPGWEFLDLKFFLEKHLRRDVDLVTYKALKPQLKDTILKEVTYIA
jgi:predicted nucleotidyltransferase